MSRDGVTWRLYKGRRGPGADPFIAAAKMGAANTPAYRGTAYVVFEELPLERFGNRLPQLSFEVFRPDPRQESAESLVRAVTLIPASGEFAYATEIVRRGTATARPRPENVNAEPDAADLALRSTGWRPARRRSSRLARRRLVRRRPARRAIAASARASEVSAKPRRRRTGRSTASVARTRISSARTTRDGRPTAARPRTAPWCRRSGAEGPRLPGHLLSVHPDGRGGGQRRCPTRTATTPRHRPADLSLARPDHLLASGGLCRHPDTTAAAGVRSPPSSARPAVRLRVDDERCRGTAIPDDWGSGG